MSSLEKLIAKLKKCPTDIRFKELQKILNYYGYQLTHTKGSHFRFKKKNHNPLTIVVHNNKVKKWYIKDILNEINI